MENQDKLYEQFQQASQKAESKGFPAMDKVWARVEDKLDHKVLKNENKLWKKIAIAASFLLLFTLGYQSFKDNREVIEPQNTVVNTEIEATKTDAIIIEKEEKIETPSLVNTQEAEKIIQGKIATQETVAIVENDAKEPVVEASDAETTSDKQKAQKEKSPGYFNTRKFNAVGVQSSLAAKETAHDSIRTEQITPRKDPLFVVDGRAMTNKNDDKLDTLLKKENINNEDIESFEILPEPLYIINGTEYSEEELFGSNPTSPYFPLDRQEILSTTVLLEKEATAIYGEKGKKGVVIISTKNGKPLKK